MTENDLETILVNFYNILSHKGKGFTALYFLNTSSNNNDFLYVDNAHDFIDFVNKYSGKGQLYVSVNPVRERLKKSHTNKDVTAVNNIYIDIDAKKYDIDLENVKKFAATEEEYKKSWEAIDILKKWLVKRGFKIGYYDKTGNGVRFILPIPAIVLTNKNWNIIPSRIRAFYNLIERDTGLKLDSVQDLRRITGIPCTLNMKKETDTRKNRIREPMNPIPERDEDDKLRNFILGMDIGGAPFESKSVITRGNIDNNKLSPELIQKMSRLMSQDEKLNNLFKGNWKVYNYTSRSEAELALYIKLIQAGFTDDEIFAILNTTKIGKWKSSKPSYKERTKIAAYRFISEKIQKSMSEDIIKVEIEDGIFLISKKDDKTGQWLSSIMKKEEVIGQEVNSQLPLWINDDKRDRTLRQALGIAGIGNKFTRSKYLMNAITKVPNSTRCKLLKKKETPEEEDFIYIPEMTWNKVKETIGKYLLIEDWTPIIITLAVVATNKLPGDPVWLLSIAPPGAGKSETIRAYTPKGIVNKFVHSISSITPKTFISGLPENKDLLPRLDGKIVTIKDFTTILTKQKDVRNEILSQLREIFDGYYSTETGSGIGTKGYYSKFTLIAGCTPYIDHFGGLQALLGERFLRIRDHSISGDEEDEKYRSDIINTAFIGEGNEDSMRQDIANHVLSLYQEFDPNRLPDLPDNIANLIKYCANIVAVLRTGVTRDGNHNITSIPEPEYGTRLVKQLKKLSIAIAALLGKSEVDIECVSLIYRVSLDTIEKRRVEILRHIEWEEKATSRIAAKTTLPTNTVKEILEDLWILGICDRVQGEDDNDDINSSNKPYMWKLKSCTVVDQIDTVEKCLKRVDTYNRKGIHYIHI